MKISDKAYVIILLIAILVLSLISYRRFKEFDQSLSEIELPEIPSSEITLPGTNLEDFLPPEKEGYQEWISPDGKLKLQYPASWTRLDEALLEYSDQTETSLTESGILFFAHRIDIKEQTLAILTVSETDAEKSLEKIIERMGQDAEEQGGKIGIMDVKTEGEIAWIETLSEYPNQPNYYSKVKLIFTENKTYLIVFSAPQTYWPQLKEEANEIFGSAHLPS